ncbi:MAG TPA: hypothetical protein VFX27_10930 [Sphingobium sp.]|nr:hypothetical protein [Sphingobium sp.]
MKRRALVLTSESARHPFRQTLPPHVLAPLRDLRRRDDQDIKLFMMSFAAFFVATYSFIV